MIRSFRIIFLFFLLVCFASCAVVQYPVLDQSKESLLESELLRWHTFKITGLVELQYQAFSFRGDAIIAKTTEKFRFDILNQGILGLGGGVLTSFYADESGVQARMPGSSSIETYTLDSPHGKLMSFFSEKIFQDIYEQKDVIVQTLKCEFEGFEIIFTPEMRLSEINNKHQNIRINFNYDRHNNLHEITILTPITRNFVIYVDKIDHENIIVNSLI